MAAPAQDTRGYFVWKAAGSPVTIHIRWDVIERLAAEIKREFNAVLPKRGNETGGLLLGSIEEGNPAIVRIEDIHPVPCKYREGPSYLFTQYDGGAFVEACMQWQPAMSPSTYAVGFFRSHTRDGFALALEDIDLLDHFFPGPSHVALLVKPFAARANSGAFFVREQGAFPETSRLEFPLRRREQTVDDLYPPELNRPHQFREFRPGLDEVAVAPAPSHAPQQPARARDRWMWPGIAILFLLLGVVLGFQAALTLAARAPDNAAPEFNLALTVVRRDDALSVKWDRQSPAIRSSKKGVLEIEDGGISKPVDLDRAELQNGTLIYRTSAKSVRFRLTVYPQDRITVTETREWKQ